MQSLTSWVLSHKKTVVIGWVALFLFGAFTINATTDKLDQRFSTPGRESQEANDQILKTFGNGNDDGPDLAVVKLTKPASQEKAALSALEAKVAKTLPGARVAGYASTGSEAFLSKDQKTTFVVAYPRPDPDAAFFENTKAAERLTAALKSEKIDGQQVRVTGFYALSNDAGTDEGGGTGLLLEALLGGVGALLVLFFVFGSALAFLPIVVAAFSIMSTFFLLFVATRFTSLSPVVQFLVALIGLGVAIDYALLLTTRWREERTHGHSNDEALQIAAGTAGRAVVFSGITVAVGLVALVVLPLPFLRSIGFGGMLIPLMSVAVTITLLPVFLSKFGPALDKHRLRNDDMASASWTAWARLVVRFRWVAALVAIVFLGLLVGRATNIELGIGNLDTIAKSGQSVVALKQLEESGIGPGALTPHEIVVDNANPRAAAGIAHLASEVDNIHGAVAPEAWRKGNISVVNAFPRPDPSTSAAGDTVDGLRNVVGPDAKVGGQIAGTADFVDATYGNFPYVLAIIAIITFVLLARAFRSIVLPIKAIILNLVSVGAAYGVLEVVWQAGHGSSFIWGVAATGSITSWIPLMIFAFLFGLSMDYEVFILSRMREVYDATGDTTASVVEGIGRTGRLVTSAALILFLTFASFASAPETDSRIIATGLAAGILIDATIIRALLVPAVVSLFGKWNWWLPSGLAKVLRVAPSGV